MDEQRHENLREGRRPRSRTFIVTCLALLSIVLLGAYGNDRVDDHPAASMARKMGMPEQFLLGLGNTEIGEIKAQNIKVDIVDRYLVGVGEFSWVNWNAPRGEFIRVATEAADAVGAVPMFTLAQMAWGDDQQLLLATDRSFMAQYWRNVSLLFLKLGQYDRPALVNLEPDFWGHAQKSALDGDPASVAVRVSINPDCADLPDNATGLAACFIRSARRYAPRTQIGFPISDWGASSPLEVAGFMKRLGAGQADFIVLPSEKLVAAVYDFRHYVEKVRFYHEALDGLPVLVWRAPLGAASGNSTGNHVHDFLNFPEDLVAAGAIGAVFCAGETGPVDIKTDGGQFRILSLQYAADPAPLS